jgi:uncharacterized protein (TIGR02271 family)
MAAKQNSAVVGIFNSRTEADQAVDKLLQAGFTRDTIGVVARNHDGKTTTQHKAEDGTYAEEGAVAGLVAGAGVAGLVSLGISVGVIPVIGPILAVGPLAAALISAAGGAAAAGLAGGLIGWGIPEHEAAFYESEVQEGRYLVTVQAAGRHDEAWKILHTGGGYNYATASQVGRTTTAPRGKASGTAGESMTLHEEQLHATKDRVKTGEVTLRKEVVTEQRTINVPVQREEIVIERHAASGRASAGDIKPGEVIRVPVSEERVHVEKETVATEEVSVGKRVIQDTEHVAGTVRKETAKVEQSGEVTVEGNVKPTKK